LRRLSTETFNETGDAQWMEERMKEKKEGTKWLTE
jgi:hypothetical protein